MAEEKQIFDTIIIGSGPAGLTAAIYNVRADLKTMVIAGDQPGGQLTITTMVDNYPGFPHGIGGVKLMMDMQDQVKNLGVEIKMGKVEKVIKTESRLFRVILLGGEILETKAVIVATGAKAKWIGVPGEKEMVGHGVSGCATCDGMFFRDKVVAVVGGGDTACEDSTFLAKFAKKVYLLHRRDSLRASAVEQKKVFGTPIEILWNTEVKEVLGKEKVEALRILNNKTNEEKELAVDGLFVAIGHNPATDFVKGMVELTEEGYVVVGKCKPFPTMTNIEGIFAAGDCADSRYRQAIVAAGDGCRAALDAEKWIEGGC